MTTEEQAIWLVRHAPTSWTGRRWCGRADPPLSPDGRIVALALAERLATELGRGATIWTSPARRARETASAIASAAGGEIVVVDDLIEVDVGRVEGMTWGELSTREPALGAAIDRGGPVDWPGGESAIDVAARAARMAAAILDAAAAGAIVVVSHGAFLHALAIELGDPTDLPTPALEAGGVLRLGRRRAA